MWNRQSKSQSTVKEKPDEVQEIQNINARDNVAEPDAFEGKELTKKEQKKLEEKLAEAVASTGQDEQNKQDTASKRKQIHSHRKFSNQKWSSHQRRRISQKRTNLQITMMSNRQSRKSRQNSSQL